MLFQANEAMEITGFGGLAGPGSHFYPIVEVMSRCHLFHLYMAMYDGTKFEHINRHFISTKIDPILELTKGDQVESASIFLHRPISGKTISGSAKLNLVQEIYEVKSETDSAYLYVVQSNEEVFDFLHDFRGQKIQKTLIYKHGDILNNQSS